MKLSTKGRYGVRLMFDLALHYGEGTVSLKDVAKRQGISEKYLWHLIPPLKNAGLIIAKPGTLVGLNTHPAWADLAVYRAKQRSTGIELFELEHASLCKRASGCVAREVWTEVADKMLRALESFTLEEMLEKERGKQEAITYSI